MISFEWRKLLNKLYVKIRYLEFENDTYFMRDKNYGMEGVFNGPSHFGFLHMIYILIVRRSN